MDGAGPMSLPSPLDLQGGLISYPSFAEIDLARLTKELHTSPRVLNCAYFGELPR
jgi:hypothetical protein